MYDEQFKDHFEAWEFDLSTGVDSVSYNFKYFKCGPKIYKGLLLYFER